MKYVLKTLHILEIHLTTKVKNNTVCWNSFFMMVILTYRTILKFKWRLLSQSLFCFYLIMKITAHTLFCRKHMEKLPLPEVLVNTNIIMCFWGGCGMFDSDPKLLRDYPRLWVLETLLWCSVGHMFFQDLFLVLLGSKFNISSAFLCFLSYSSLYLQCFILQVKIREVFTWKMHNINCLYFKVSLVTLK